MEQWIEIEARIVEHAPGALRDHFEDGSVAVYDATVLTVRLPPGLMGRDLTIFHHRPVGEDSPWCRVGAKLRLRLLAEALGEDRQVFDGAVRDVELVEEGSRRGEAAGP